MVLQVGAGRLGMPDESPLPRQLSELARDLSELERDAAGPEEEAARRRGDAALLAALKREGYRGPSADKFIDQLTRYGLAVIGAWLCAGVLDDKARRVGRPPRRSVAGLSLTEDDRLAIVDLTVTYGLALFRRAVFEKEQWRPDGGAGLKTFFIRSCLLTYSNALGAWRPDRMCHEIPAEFLDDLAVVHGADPAEIVADRVSAWQALDAISDPLTRRIVVAISRGLTSKQVAEALGEGLTEGAVEMRLVRLRRRITTAAGLARTTSGEAR